MLSTFRHSFKIFYKAVEVVCKIREAERDDIISDHTSQNSSKRFKKDHFCLEMKLRSGEASLDNLKDLKQKMEMNINIRTHILSQELHCQKLAAFCPVI